MQFIALLLGAQLAAVARANGAAREETTTSAATTTRATTATNSTLRANATISATSTSGTALAAATTTTTTTTISACPNSLQHDMLTCYDGTQCSISESPSCCLRHGGRMKCPGNLPFMCAQQLCTSDHCCTSLKESCDRGRHGGLLRSCPVSGRSCTTDEFKCGNGLCIKDFLMCDGTSDCNDSSDETGCVSFNQYQIYFSDLNQHLACVESMKLIDLNVSEIIEKSNVEYFGETYETATVKRMVNYVFEIKCVDDKCQNLKCEAEVGGVYKRKEKKKVFWVHPNRNWHNNKCVITAGEEARTTAATITQTATTAGVTATTTTTSTSTARTNAIIDAAPAAANDTTNNTTTPTTTTTTTTTKTTRISGVKHVLFFKDSDSIGYYCENSHCLRQTTTTHCPMTTTTSTTATTTSATTKATTSATTYTTTYPTITATNYTTNYTTTNTTTYTTTYPTITATNYTTTNTTTYTTTYPTITATTYTTTTAATYTTTNTTTSTTTTTTTTTTSNTRRLSLRGK